MTDISKLRVGSRVRVCGNKWTQFEIFGKFEGTGLNKRWVDDPNVPRPWYPFFQMATVSKISGDAIYVRTDDGREWSNSTGFWAVELESEMMDMRG